MIDNFDINKLTGESGEILDDEDANEDNEERSKEMEQMGENKVRIHRVLHAILLVYENEVVTLRKAF